MTRGNDRLIGQWKDFLPDAIDECCHVSTHQVGAAHTAVEDGVTRDEQTALRQIKSQTTRGMSRHVQHLNGLAAQGNHFAILEMTVDGQHIGLDLEMELGHLLGQVQP